MSDPFQSASELTVKLFSPFEVMYEGKARALSASNELGSFDVLPDHTKFMTLLTSGEVKILTSVDTRTFVLEHGILRVSDNTVTVFANI